MKAIHTLLFLLITIFIIAQTNDSITPPEYVLGDKQLYSTMGRNIGYPPDARDNGKQGVVYASVLLGSSGTLDSIWIHRGFHPECDVEVYRALKKMAAWSPAKRNGEKVSAQINFAFGFYLTRNPISKFDSTKMCGKISSAELVFNLEEFFIIEYAVPLNGGMNYGPSFDERYKKCNEALKNGNNEEALKCYNKVFRGDPQNPDILHKRGIAKHRLGNTKGACKDWKSVVKLGGESSQVFLNMYCKDD